MNKSKIIMLLIFYLVLVSLVLSLLNFSEMIKAYIALIGFIIIPYLIGALIINVFNFSFNGFMKYVLTSIIGLFTIILIYLMFSLLRLKFVYFFYFTLTLVLFSALFILFKLDSKHSVSFSLDKKYPYFLLFFISILGIIYLWIHNIIPTIPSYSQYAFIGRANSFLNNEPTIFLKSAYFPYISLLYAINSLLFDVPILRLSQTLPYLLILIYSLGVFSFSYSISRKKSVAILSTFLSIWLFEMTWFKHFTSAIPRTLLLSIFPWILCLVHKYILNQNNKKRMGFSFFLQIFFTILPLIGLFLFDSDYSLSTYYYLGSWIFSFSLLFIFYKFRANHKREFFLLGFLVLFILSIHKAEGFLYVFLILIYSLIYVSIEDKKIKKKFNIISILILFLIGLFIVFQYIGFISFQSSSIISESLFGYKTIEDLNLNFNDKYNFLIDSNSSIIWGIFLVSVLCFPFLDNKSVKLSLIIVGIMYFLYFFPENQFVRSSIGQTNLFFSIFLSYFLIIFLKMDSKKITNLLRISLTIVLLIIVSLNPYTKLALELKEEGKISQMFEDYEIDSFIWINKNVDKGAVFLSDPYTANTIRRVSWRSIYFEPVWLSELEYDPLSLSRMDDLKNILKNNDSKKIYRELVKFERDIFINNTEINRNENIMLTHSTRQDSPIYILISGRVCKWIQENKRIYVSYLIPTGFLLEESCLNKFDDDSLFFPVYNSGELIIFKLK